MTLSAGGKVGGEYWGKDSGELEMLFHRGELLTGCMDKAQYGRHGLLHGIQVWAPQTSSMVTLLAAAAYEGDPHVGRGLSPGFTVIVVCLIASIILWLRGNGMQERI